MSDYAQRYFNGLLAVTGVPLDPVRIIGEIDGLPSRQPHVAFFVELTPGDCLASTAGLAHRPMPLPVSEGFQYFELCARTTRDSPRVLRLLSYVGNFMLATAAPLFYGDPEMNVAAGMPSPKPFLPYQTVLFSGDGERVLLVPRWNFWVPDGPPVDVIEPLPLSKTQAIEIAALALDDRAAWVDALPDPRVQWETILGA